MDRVIKVYNNNGRYGFTKGGFGMNFASVPDLVNYYRNTSLKDYNTILDIKLLYPVSRFNQEEDLIYNQNDIEKLAHKYLELRKELVLRETSYENFLNMYKRIEHDLDIKRQATDAFHEAEQLFNEQLKTQQTLSSEAQPHEIDKLKENMDLLKTRLSQLTECQNDLLVSYDKQKTQFFAYERNIQTLKPLINELRKNIERIVTQLNKHGIKDHQIKEIEEQGYKAWCNQENLKLPHLDEKTWFLSVSRSEAEQLLCGMPTGTFLVRARNAGDYALSITCNGITNHCIINETENGFGFAEPFNIFDSLMTLVKHYAQNSLEEHNDVLQTTLRWPVKCSYILNIKEQQKQGIAVSLGGTTTTGSAVDSLATTTTNANLVPTTSTTTLTSPQEFLFRPN